VSDSIIMNLIHVPLFQCLLLVSFIPAALSHAMPEAVVAGLSKRASFLGGWAVYTPGGCPDQTSQCPLKKFCCPTGTVCSISGLAGAAVCCPDRKCAPSRITLPPPNVSVNSRVQFRYVCYGSCTNITHYCENRERLQLIRKSGSTMR
jgi:hypothetical protein